MASYTAIYSVANTINKVHNQSGLHFGHTNNLYHDKQVFINKLFCQFIKPLLKDIDIYALIQE